VIVSDLAVIVFTLSQQDQISITRQLLLLT